MLTNTLPGFSPHNSPLQLTPYNSSALPDQRHSLTNLVLYYPKKLQTAILKVGI